MIPSATPRNNEYVPSVTINAGSRSLAIKSALRAALREDPDILLVGELRHAAEVAVALGLFHFVAGEFEGCLSPEQRRAVIASRQAIPLGKALRAAKARLGGEVVRARLCKEGSELVYVLTVLAHDGKVTLATIDGTSGAFIDGR